MKSVREPASLSLGPGERLLLHDVSWEEYEELLEELAEHRWRLAYDEGKLEIMSPSQKHEDVKHFIGSFVEALTEELDIEIRCWYVLTCQEPISLHLPGGKPWLVRAEGN